VAAKIDATKIAESLLLDIETPRGIVTKIEN
jgi:uncharacterized alpha-E superfamily protein